MPSTRGSSPLFRQQRNKVSRYFPDLGRSWSPSIQGSHRLSECGHKTRCALGSRSCTFLGSHQDRKPLFSARNDADYRGFGIVNRVIEYNGLMEIHRAIDCERPLRALLSLLVDTSVRPLTGGGAV